MTQRFLLLCIPTFLFLTFFSGLYIYLYIYYLRSSFEWFAFEGSYQPSDAEILFSGFMDIYQLLSNLIISGIFAFLGVLFLQGSKIGNMKVKIIWNGIILSLLLGGLYSIYHFVLKTGWNFFYDDGSTAIKVVLILTACYTLIALLLTNLFYKMYRKDLESTKHSTQH